MDKGGCEALAFAIIQQAVDDWRRLCAGGKETNDCNFAELTRFFKEDCDSYITGTSTAGETILKRLQKERRMI